MCPIEAVSLHVLAVLSTPKSHSPSWYSFLCNLVLKAGSLNLLCRETGARLEALSAGTAPKYNPSSSSDRGIRLQCHKRPFRDLHPSDEPFPAVCPPRLYPKLPRVPTSRGGARLLVYLICR